MACLCALWKAAFSGITSLWSHSACQQGTGSLVLPIHRAEKQSEGLMWAGPLLELCCENEVLGQASFWDQKSSPRTALQSAQLLWNCCLGTLPAPSLWSPGSAGIITSSLGEAASFSTF